MFALVSGLPINDLFSASHISFVSYNCVRRIVALIHYRIPDISPVEGAPDSQPHPWMIRKLHSQPTRMLVLEAIRPFEKVAAILSLGRIKAEVLDFLYYSSNAVISQP